MLLLLLLPLYELDETPINFYPNFRQFQFSFPAAAVVRKSCLPLYRGGGGTEEYKSPPVAPPPPPLRNVHTTTTTFLRKTAAIPNPLVGGGCEERG